ncbi:MAG: CHAP domain-containing protein [Fimbriimonas sp.]
MSPRPKSPAFDYSTEEWEGFDPPARALLLAAQYCDHYRVEEAPRGSNRGPWVDKFLRRAQSVPGQPWCAAFVYDCFRDAGMSPRVAYPASVASWADYARRFGRVREEPARGRLFYFTNRDGSGHMGFVVRVRGDSVETIEGNTNDMGLREGYRVARRMRKSAGLTFIEMGSEG